MNVPDEEMPAWLLLWAMVALFFFWPLLASYF